jgi:hypothetical protein
MKISSFYFVPLLAVASRAFSPFIPGLSVNHRRQQGLSALSLSTKTETEKILTTETSSQESSELDYVKQQGGFSYVEFAKENPFANNILIATSKTAAADLIAQLVIAQTPIAELDVQRSLLFCLFGAFYLGAFQYLYQVQVSIAEAGIVVSIWNSYFIVCFEQLLTTTVQTSKV